MGYFLKNITGYLKSDTGKENVMFDCGVEKSLKNRSNWKSEEGEVKLLKSEGGGQRSGHPAGEWAHQRVLQGSEVVGEVFSAAFSRNASSPFDAHYLHQGGGPEILRFEFLIICVKYCCVILLVTNTGLDEKHNSMTTRHHKCTVYISGLLRGQNIRIYWKLAAVSLKFEITI